MDQQNKIEEETRKFLYEDDDDIDDKRINQTKRYTEDT